MGFRGDVGLHTMTNDPSTNVEIEVQITTTPLALQRLPPSGSPHSQFIAGDLHLLLCLVVSPNTYHGLPVQPPPREPRACPLG
jgi:hypothetical protein